MAGVVVNQQDRTRIQRLCTELRAPSWPTWDAAGTEAFILELAQRMPNDPIGVAITALTAARNPGNTTPKSMLAVVETVPAPSVTPAPTPRRTDPECPVCGSQLRTVNDECVGCLQNAAEERGPRPVSPAPASLRPSGPCPPEVKQRIEAGFAARRVVAAHGGRPASERTTEGENA